MKTVLAIVTALVSLAWGGSFLLADPTGASLPWTVRHEVIYLSGLLSIAMMSLAMFLAARPAWLEKPLGGLDRMYRIHKWAGILAGIFAALHWLFELSGDLLKGLIGRAGRVPKEPLEGLAEMMRHFGKDMGEWAIYLVLPLIVLALWKRIPYRVWRTLHKVMPVLYLMLVAHSILLAPASWWTGPAGLLLAPLLVAGTYGGIRALTGGIGRARKTKARISAIEHPTADIVTVRCQPGSGWRGHQAGQFAFVAFDPREGAHPFTIASADGSGRTVDFQIKALGDHTRALINRLQPGQEITLEGPYGCFELSRRNPGARQIWIAGGIGVTPFLSWLESLQQNPAQAPAADLHYCTRDSSGDPFAARLASLCASLPGIRLHVHGDRQGNLLDIASLADGRSDARAAEIWFCGPQGFAEKLKQDLRARWRGRFRFHQEAFEMR